MATEHKLELIWITDDPAALKAAIEALATEDLGDLVVPIWGTFSNCRLSNISEWVNITPTDDSKYLIRATLTFTEYPTA